MEPLLKYKQMSEGDLDPLLNNLLDLPSSTPLKVGEFIKSFLSGVQGLSHFHAPLFRIQGVYLTGSSLTHLFTPLEELPEDIDVKILIKATQAAASDCFAFLRKTAFIPLNGKLHTLEEIASSKALCILETYSFNDYVVPGFQECLPLNLSFILSEEVKLSSVFNADSLYLELNLFPHPPSYSLGSSRPLSFDGYLPEKNASGSFRYRPVGNLNIDAAMKNVILLPDNQPLTSEVFIYHLLDATQFLIEGCWLQVEVDAPLDSPSIISPLSIQLLLLLKGSEKESKTLLNHLETIRFLQNDHSWQTLSNFSLKFGSFDSQNSLQKSM